MQDYTLTANNLFLCRIFQILSPSLLFCLGIRELLRNINSRQLDYNRQLELLFYLQAKRTSFQQFKSPQNQQILRQNSDKFYEYFSFSLIQRILLVGDISGSHGGEYEDDCLLGCCAV
jgi:hypothetical protein